MIDKYDARRSMWNKINGCFYDDYEGDAKKRLRDDLKEEYEVTENPKADLLFDKAWDLGHANGYHEVLNHWDDLIDLIL